MQHPRSAPKASRQLVAGDADLLLAQMGGRFVEDQDGRASGRYAIAAHTSPITAHRLSAFQSAHAIVVMEASRIIEAAAHAKPLAEPTAASPPISRVTPPVDETTPAIATSHFSRCLLIDGWPSSPWSGSLKPADISGLDTQLLMRNANDIERSTFCGAASSPAIEHLAGVARLGPAMPYGDHSRTEQLPGAP